MYALGVAADRYTRLLEEIHIEFPRFRLVRKHESRFQRAIHYGLMIITFGGMRHYLDSYQTTIGNTIYVTRDWDERDPRERYITMQHERVHLRQFHRYSLLGMALLYLLIPLPMGLAYFRARFEKEAYEQSIRTAASIYGIDHVRHGSFREHIVAQFLGPSYGWMWPFRRRINAWYDGIVQDIEHNGTSTTPDGGQS